MEPRWGGKGVQKCTIKIKLASISVIKFCVLLVVTPYRGCGICRNDQCSKILKNLQFKKFYFCIESDKILSGNVEKLGSIKGTVSRDFWVQLFLHQTVFSGPIRITLGRFRGEILQYQIDSLVQKTNTKNLVTLSPLKFGKKIPQN